MFKCCVCNKSLKKEKQAAELAKSTPKHGQKGTDSQVPVIISAETIKAEGNGDITHSEKKLNGDVQKFEKLPSPPMDERAEDADDLTTKSPVPSGKRDESQPANGTTANELGPQAKVEQEKSVDKSEATTEGVVESTRKEETRGSSTGSKDDAGDTGGGGKGSTETKINHKIPVVIKTNLSDSPVSIQKSLYDGLEDEGDDSVFEASPNHSDPSKKKPTVSIPRWLSEEEEHDSEGCSGMQEPPATPVARDELALRRHRFFSDLLHATQNASEHRVRFDPLGPMVHTGCEASDKEDHLEELVTRLENVTKRLEKVRTPSGTSTQETAVQTSTPSPKRATPASNSVPVQRQVPSSAQLPNKVAPSKPVNMSSTGYEDLLAGPVSEYLRLSEKIGGDVATHSKLVEQAFRTQLQFIQTAVRGPQPASQSEQVALLAPTSSQIQKIQEFRESNRGSQFFNHLSAISESIPALGWVAVAPTPAPYVKEMNDAGQFYTNRVLKDWKEKNKIHVEWCKAWVQTLTDLQQYVRQHHTTGLVWGKAGSGPAPAGIPPPPPPSMPMMDVAPMAVNDDRSALFAEINQGEAITKNLKKVTSEMQTHKNPSLRTGPAPFKAPIGNSIPTKIVPPANAPIDKPPVFTRDGKKWLVEYHKGNRDLLIDNVEMNNVVYMFRCQDSTLVIKGKINSVVMDSCRKSSVVFDSVVASVEFVNCQSVQMQVLGKVPTISIDKTDGCQMYLNSESMDVEVITSKSSEMNVMVPKASGDYAEYPVPEQFKTTISPKGLSTIAVDSLG